MNLVDLQINRFRDIFMSAENACNAPTAGAWHATGGCAGAKAWRVFICPLPEISSSSWPPRLVKSAALLIAGATRPPAPLGRDRSENPRQKYSAAAMGWFGPVNPSRFVFIML
jgi:hypothetical protein